MKPDPTRTRIRFVKSDTEIERDHLRGVVASMTKVLRDTLACFQLEAYREERIAAIEAVLPK